MPTTELTHISNFRLLPRSAPISAPLAGRTRVKMRSRLCCCNPWNIKRPQIGRPRSNDVCADGMARGHAHKLRTEKKASNTIICRLKTIIKPTYERSRPAPELICYDYHVCLCAPNQTAMHWKLNGRSRAIFFCARCIHGCRMMELCVRPPLLRPSFGCVACQRGKKSTKLR